MDFLNPKKITSLNNISKCGAQFIASVKVTAVQADGKILVGGNFTNYTGSTRHRLIRLNVDGTLDIDFVINASEGAKFSTAGDILSIAVQADGKILVGGPFIAYGGTTGRSYLIRLNSNGTLDTTFCANAVDGTKFSGTVYSIVVQPDQQILVGGTFINYGISGRSRLVRLNSDGTTDTTFCANATDGVKFSGIVWTIVLQPNQQILVGGSFVSYGGTSNRSRLIRLDSTGVVDATFCANAADGAKVNAAVYSIAIQPLDNKILVGGGFTNYAAVSGRDYLVRLNSTGTLDTSVDSFSRTFHQNAVDTSMFNAQVNTISVQTNGNILVGGSFTTYALTSKSYCIKLDSYGIVDETFSTNFAPNAFVNTIVTQPSDNKLLIGGSFNYTTVTGPNRGYFSRMSDAGVQDTNFLINACNGPKFNSPIIPKSISTIVVQPSDGKIILGGQFVNYNKVTNKNKLIRFNTNGTLDTTFCTNAVDGAKFNNTVNTIAIQPLDNKILVGGAFTAYGGTTGRSYLIRLNSDGTLDTTFCTNAVDGTKFSGSVQSILVQSDGKILLGGGFTNYGTTGRNYFIRLDSTGVVDTSFCTNATDANKFNASIQSIAIQTNGQILVGGSFSNYATTTGRSYFIRLNAIGTIDASFCLNSSDVNKFSTTVSSIAVQSDGKILAGGSFINYAATTGRNYFIRLDSTGVVDATFCANTTDSAKFNAAVNTIIAQTNGKILVGGSFNPHAATAGRSYLVGFNADGTIDTEFCANAVDGSKFNGAVYAATTQADTKILVTGDFTTYKFSRLLFDKLIRFSPKGLLA